MNIPSPIQSAGNLVTSLITANGAPIPDTVQVRSIDVWVGVNKLPRARVVINDGDVAAANFPISESALLIPGVEITIAMGYDGVTERVFSGVIQSQGISISGDGPSQLIIEATDKALAMTLARSNAIFSNSRDSDAITKLIKGAGLTAHVAETEPRHPVIVQSYASDWDWVAARAQVNSMVIIVDDGVVTVAPPSTSSTPVLNLTYGVSILDFNSEIDAATQFSADAFKSYAWAPSTQKVTVSRAATSDVTTPGNLTSDELARVFDVAAVPHQTAGTLSIDDLTNWSSAELLKSRLAKVLGTVRFQGSALAQPGVMIELAGLGDRFNGNAYVAGVHHHVADGNWTTSVNFGLSPEWFAKPTGALEVPDAAGQIPGIANLLTGIVLQTDGDPEGAFRVRIALPLLQAGASGLWARLGNTYASNGFGAAFYPEIGDEVVVAFMNNDPRFPVILGSLYSKTRPPPFAPDATNNRKSIRTRTGLQIDFYDSEGAVEIHTPGKQSVRLDDTGKSIAINDMNGNLITMSPQGISISSAAALTLYAKSNITIKSDASVTVTGENQVSISGMIVQTTASGTLTLKGNASAELSASGITTVKGALVNIN